MVIVIPIISSGTISPQTNRMNKKPKAAIIQACFKEDMYISLSNGNIVDGFDLIVL